MVTVPAVEPLANPPPLIDATLESDELHVTELLMSFVVPSESCAVATNCCVLPMPIDMDDGEIANDETVGVELFEPDDCELFPDAPPPQPQFSAPSNKTAINETFFMTFSRFAFRDARAHPDRFVVRCRWESRNGRASHSAAFKVRVEVSIVHSGPLS